MTYIDASPPNLISDVENVLFLSLGVFLKEQQL